jgi:hypothetical protein
VRGGHPLVGERTRGARCATVAVGMAAGRLGKDGRSNVPRMPEYGKCGHFYVGRVKWCIRGCFL